ncbi:MAG TPA: PQQ-dependent sugar dehydrogenase [Ottowia sp.]|uniref:PQQ-dependent sugar dehydrogenase n=1 Tax=Ottowia sp. TaxID=1898956 RepID=UPI002C79F214|nr:PQQ-dependent sugar dehydrogenase [Ottowia sp.]HRN05898.1 PQQ-dependent sugar dehydrogenase [Ottowia sp.]
MAPTFPSTTAPFVLAGLLALAAAPSVAQSQPSPKAQTVASGLQNPWAVAFLPDGRFLVTERPGRLRVVNADGQVQPAVQGLPEVAAGGQGGLLDVITDSAFASNRTIYFCFSEPGKGTTNSTALARARLSDDLKQLQDMKVIFSQQPKVSSTAHFGCRIVERQVNGKPDGTLLLTLGERFSRRDDAQTLDNHHGKIVRVGKDGSVPKDNPFVGKAGALPEIWSYGHRNSQGATLAPDGSLWTHEHGARGGDEINRPQAGKNHGWPLVSFGVNYDGSTIGTGKSSAPGLEPPLHHWTPSIAPSGMAFLTSDRYGAAWKGNLFVGSLKFQYLDRIELKDGQVVAEHKLLEDLGQRIRDVRQGPDGLLYVLTDNANGRLIRLLHN